MKKRLTSKERKGLTAEHAKAVDLYLRANPNTQPISPVDAVPLYELFMLGYSPEEIHKRFPNHPVEVIVYTATSNGWLQDRNQLASTVYNRIRTKIVRSTVEQVEFLTDMVSVCTTETQEEVRKYLQDPQNNPPPQMRIGSIKQYQQVMEMLANIANTVKAIAEDGSSGKDKSKVHKSEAKLLAELTDDENEEV